MILRRIVWPLLCCVALVQTAGADEDRDLNRAKIHTELSTQYFLRGQYGYALEEANIAIKAKRAVVVGCDLFQCGSLTRARC